MDGRQWRAAPGKPPARREFERAIELRETLHRLFDAEAQDKTPAARDLAALNEALAAAPAAPRSGASAAPMAGRSM